MRDYRHISVEEFVAESIGMKMRWLARGLRRWDKYNEIEAWVKSMTTLWELLQKIRPDGAALTQRLELQPFKRNIPATSPPMQKSRIESRRVVGEENTKINSMELNSATTRKRTASQTGLSEDPWDNTEEHLEQKKKPWGLSMTKETFTLKKSQGMMEVEIGDHYKIDTGGTMELEELPGIELSTEKADDQVIAGGLVSESEETRLGVEKKNKILWEAIEEKIGAKTNATEGNWRKEYFREEDYDRLLNDTAKEAQIAVNSDRRAYIASKMRLMGYYLGFNI